MPSSRITRGSNLNCIEVVWQLVVYFSRLKREETIWKEQEITIQRKRNPSLLDNG